MKSTPFERWSPWLLLFAVIALWQIVCSAFDVSEFIFPSPLRIWTISPSTRSPVGWNPGTWGRPGNGRPIQRAFSGGWAPGPIARPPGPSAGPRMLSRL